MPKVINIEPTPNPDALKFLVHPAILKAGSRSFKDFGAAVGDPLGSCLFGLGKVTSVFYMDRFVTVNKEPSAEWSDLIDPICEAIEELKLPENQAGDMAPLTSGGDADATLERINHLLDTRIRPGLAGDGGGPRDDRRHRVPPHPFAAHPSRRWRRGRGLRVSGGCGLRGCGRSAQRMRQRDAAARGLPGGCWLGG